MGPASRSTRMPRISAKRSCCRRGSSRRVRASSRSCRRSRCTRRRLGGAPVTALDFVHIYQPPATPAARSCSSCTAPAATSTILVPLAGRCSPGAGILSPRGKVLERGMPRFFRRLAEGVFDIDDLKLRTAGAGGFHPASAAKHYGFRPGHVIAVGFSNGANIAGALLLLRPDTLGGAVLFRAMVPLTPGTLPNIPATPVFISNGKMDPLVSVVGNGTARRAPAIRGCGRDRLVAERRSRAHRPRRHHRAGMAGAAIGALTTRLVSHRCRIGFNTSPASSAVAKFIAMMMANTGVHEPIRSRGAVRRPGRPAPSRRPGPCRGIRSWWSRTWCRSVSVSVDGNNEKISPHPKNTTPDIRTNTVGFARVKSHASSRRLRAQTR